MNLCLCHDSEKYSLVCACGHKEVGKLAVRNIFEDRDVPFFVRVAIGGGGSLLEVGIKLLGSTK
jgi:hypothetical protein